eukprot:scaffold2957_cov226-Isochrysis_galbana.AAC.3
MSKLGEYIGARGMCGGCTGMTMGWSAGVLCPIRIVPTIHWMARRDTRTHALYRGVTNLELRPSLCSGAGRVDLRVREIVGL